MLYPGCKILSSVYLIKETQPDLISYYSLSTTNVKIHAAHEDVNCAICITRGPSLDYIRRWCLGRVISPLHNSSLGPSVIPNTAAINLTSDNEGPWCLVTDGQCPIGFGRSEKRLLYKLWAMGLWWG